MSTTKPKIWTPGDFNALFGFGTNILVNLLTLTALLRFVLKMPDDLVFGRILPATGLMMCLSTFYYAFLAYKLAQKTGRTDVCALPSGISVPHMFIVTFVVMMPIALETKNPIAGWEAGLAWVFVQSFVLMAGGYLAPIIRKITPRAALLGTLAGVSITFISMSPATQMYLVPVIGVVCFGIILMSWFGGLRYGGIPAGLIAIAVGTAVAWVSNLFGANFGGMSGANVHGSLSNFAFHFPTPAIANVFAGLKYIGVILVTAIPFGIYDLVEATDNVESAAAAGDSFPTNRVITADGVVSLIGCCMGNPFINAVYIGHPGWKSMGGRIGYSAATGIVVILLSWLGIISVLQAIIPLVAILPILLYIGMLIGAQAFQETPHKHAPAVILAIIPSLAAWGVHLIDTAFQVATQAATSVLTPDLASSVAGKILTPFGTPSAASVGALINGGGIFYDGLAIIGGGSTLAGLMLGAIAAFIIDRKFLPAAGFAFAGGVLTLFGLMHGQRVGLAPTPQMMVAASYVIVAVGLFVASKVTVTAPVTEEVPGNMEGLPMAAE